MCRCPCPVHCVAQTSYPASSLCYGWGSCGWFVSSSQGFIPRGCLRGCFLLAGAQVWGEGRLEEQGEQVERSRLALTPEELPQP